MNSSAFQSTAIPGSAFAAGRMPSSPRMEKALLVTGGALALLAIALAAVAARDATRSALLWTALASAIAGWALIRAAGVLETRRVRDQGLIDVPSGLRNLHGLAHEGAGLLAQCQRDRRPLGLVVLDFTDLPEARDIYGREVSRKLQAHVVRRLKALAGARGLCARTGRTEFTVLLPGANRDALQTRIERVLGSPTRIEFDAGDSEVVLVPDIQFESAGADLETVGELYREVATQLAQAQALEQRRQVWLSRERERHSRPMSLPPARRDGDPS